MKLCQIFDVYGQYLPTKISTYIKVVGGYRGDSFFDVDKNEYLSSEGVCIDALNFESITQSDSKLMAFDDVNGYSGNGFLRVIDETAPVDVYSVNSAYGPPSVFYPIKSTTDDLPKIYNVWIRIRAPLGSFKAEIYLDEIFEGTISTLLGTGSWEWVSIPITLEDNEKKFLGIKMFTSGTEIDKIFISPLSSAIVPTGFGPTFSVSPYITLHSEVYLVDGDGKPTEPMIIYDYKTSVNELKSNSWYNFDINFLFTSITEPFDERHALVLFSSGSNKNHYLMWESGYADEYTYGPSGLINK